MTPREIEKRLHACALLLQADLDRLKSRNVPPTAIYQPDCIARARVEFCDWVPRFEFFEGEEARDESIVCAFVFGARDGFHETIDLVAWEPKSGRLASWLGLASVLGEENTFKPRVADPCALMVHETPLQWLQANREGIVIVDERGAADLLWAVSPLLVRDPDHAKRLRSALARPSPRIVIAASAVTLRRAA